MPAGPLSVAQSAPSAGPYVIDPQSHSHVRWRRSPQQQAMLPTRTWPGVIGWPLPQPWGGRTMHAPSVLRTSSPTSRIPQVYPVVAAIER